MPKQLNAGAITQALQRAFGFKGRYVPMLDEVIVPVYVIADPSPASQTRLCAGTVQTTSAATGDPDFPFVQLFNPVDSGVMLNITSVVILAGEKLDIDIIFEDAPGVQIGADPPQFRDRRNPGDPSAELRTDAGAQLSLFPDRVARVQVDGTFSQISSWGKQSNDPRQPLSILAPGQGLLAQQVAAVGIAGALLANFIWLEIPLSEVGPLGGLP